MLLDQRQMPQDRSTGPSTKYNIVNMLRIWQGTWYTSRRMALTHLIKAGVRLAMIVGFGSAALAAQAPVATFSSGIDLVSVSAIVRDRKGRFVQNLTPPPAHRRFSTR
jgi:hypothetical protein